jgi:hypothetical protein
MAGLICNSAASARIVSSFGSCAAALRAQTACGISNSAVRSCASRSMPSSPKVSMSSSTIA